MNKLGIAAFSFTVSLLAGSLLAQSRVYVSPNGDDARDGSTPALAVRTFERGAGLGSAIGAGTVVEFADGEYVFPRTAVLNTSHSGLTFAAATGATPVFTSLVQVTGWTSHGGGIMRAPLPSGLTHVRYLQDRSENWMPRSATGMFGTPDQVPFFNNEVRAYEPGAGQSNKSLATFLTADHPTFGNGLGTAANPAPDWSKASQYDLRTHQTDWSVNIVEIAAVTGNAITLAHACTYENLGYADGDAPNVPLTEMWIMNSLVGIDSPGEWAVIDGVLYLQPSSGTGDIYVPTLTELIKVDAGGDGNTWTGTPVRDILFRGITFTGLDYVMTGAQGTSVANPGVITTQHDWGIVDGPASALRFRNAEDCEVFGCTFARSGSGGVRLDRHAQRIIVEGNTFEYLGREAVLLGGRGPGYGDVNRNNTIVGNTITAPAREKWDCPAINVDQSSSNHIHHNVIEDTHMSALHLTSSRSVYLGFLAYENAQTYYQGRESHFWEVNPSVTQFILDNEIGLGATLAKIEAQRFLYNHNNRFENNVLRDCHNMATLSNGVLYATGFKRGACNYITHNYIYDSREGTQLFYVDSYIDNLDVRGNMLHNVRNGIIWDFNGWFEDRSNRGGLGRFTANILQNSGTGFYISGLPALDANNNPLPPVWRDFGNLLFNSTVSNDNTVGSTTGVLAQLADYVDAHRVLRDQDLPNFAALPGTAAMLNSLATVIGNLGGLPASNGWSDLELGTAGTSGTPTVRGAGALLPGQPLTLRLTGALESQSAVFCIGATRIDFPFLGVTIVPNPTTALPMGIDGSGRFEFSTPWPANMPVGGTAYFQFLVFDPAGPQGLSASNGLRATTVQ